MRLPIPRGDFVKSGMTVFLGTFLASITAFFANLFISTMLGPEAFGNFRVMIYLFAFLPIVADLGINSTLTKYLSEYGRESKKIGTIIRNLLMIKAAIFASAIAVLLIFSSQIAQLFLQDYTLGYIVVAGIGYMGANFFVTFSYAMLGFQNFRTYGITQIVSAVSSAVFALALMQFGLFWTIVGWSMGPILGSIPPLLFILRKRNGWGREPIETLGILKKFSLPVYPIDISTSMFNIIVPIVSLFFVQTIVGYYSFAFMFYFAAILIPTSLSMVLFPKISELHGQRLFSEAKSILKRSFLYYTPIAAVGILATIALSEWFIGTFAQSYLPSVFMFKAIVSLGFVFGYNIIYTNYLKGLCMLKKYAIFMLVQNALLLAVSFILLSM